MPLSRTEAAYAQLFRTHTALDRAHERWLTSAGSNGARYAILAALALSGKAVTPSTISAITGRSPNAISPLLNGLQQDGLIRRTANPSDRRSHYVQLTAAGRRVAQRLRKEEAAFVRSAFGGRAARELDTLTNVLSVLEEQAASIQRDR